MRGRNGRRIARAKALGRAAERGHLIGIGADPRWIRRTAAAPTPCSSWCCGNPRRWFGEPTMAERRAPSVDEDWS